MAGANVRMATDENFENEVLKGSTPALVDFWAVWCGPCKALAPMIDEIANENSDKLRVFKLNVDDNPDTAAKYGIRGIPTILFFKDGKVAHQSVGVIPKTDLQKLVDKVV